MTLKSAERITGLEIREIPRPGKKIGSAVTYAAYDGEVEVIRRTESGHSATLHAVVDVLYRRTSRRHARRGTSKSASNAMAPESFDWPSRRSVNTMGISRSASPARCAVKCSSI